MVEKRRVWLATLMKGGTLGILLIGVLAVGCLTRPVVSQNPTTKTSFGTQVKQQSIDKIDLLFAIDNSASMGDKQDLLAEAVPVLVGRLLNPNCVDTSNTVCTTAADCSALGAGAGCDLSSGTGQCFVPSNGAACTGNTKQEFPPVHDLHIGIVTSSLGAGGSPDICVPSGSDPTHADDKGHLINRTKVANCTTPTAGCDGPPIPNANPLTPPGGNFLAWLPSSNPLNAGKTPPNVTIYNDGQQTQLIDDFKSLVQGVQERGCGLEAQLESWYRFLIQPDPYNAIIVNGGVAALQDVDTTLLKMRHDFLRPDSLVAVIQLTDEEDSWSNPLWGGGRGWVVRTTQTNLIGGPGLGLGPRGTSECDAPVDINNVANTGPNNPDCQSCGFAGNKPVSGQPIASDPNCTSCAGTSTTCQKGWYAQGQDGVNVRYTDDMKRRYGLNPQWNVQRYVDGLRLPKVPDQSGEGPANSDITAWGNVNRNCTNPLYAQDLPDGSDTSQATLCNLSPGSRTPDLVFYAIIGGVPNSLLYNSQGNFKLNLGPDDWTKILGKDPSTYQLDGIDTHMIESIAPRSGLTPPTGTYTPDTDTSEHEWNTLTSTAGIDMQYACTFQLPAAKDCTAPQYQGACDCADSNGTVVTAPDGPPLCDPANRNMQVRGKAYPTIRELRVARGLGSQAVVASLCAKDTNPADKALADYGYNPAMQAIVNRLKNILGGQCLPETLAVDTTTGEVPCVVLVIYTSQTNQAAGCTDPGLQQPDSATLARFAAQWQAQQGDAGTSTPVPVVCVLDQLTASQYTPPSCENDPNAPAGWCYVTGVSATGGCPQAIKFSPKGQPKSGTTISLECIEQRGAGDAGGGG
ncbi:MAG TPA: hypothetical protein VLM85_22745 [Polyangiaceae bacterium]|nr:hypothetical protein [Polyangiaceae bacterium]